MLLDVVQLDATLKCSELCNELSGRPAVIHLPIPWLLTILSKPRCCLGPQVLELLRWRARATSLVQGLSTNCL